MNKKKKYYLISIAILILVIPYLKFRFGSIPVYILDIVMSLSLLKFRPKLSKSNKFYTLLAVYILFSFGSFCVELLVYKNYISIYFLIRWILSFLTFIVVLELLDNINSIKIVLKTIIISATINSILSIGYALPLTRTYVEPVFSNDFIFPERSRMLDRLETEDNSQRGVTLAGGATITPVLIIPGICVLLFLYGRPKFIKVAPVVSIVLTILMLSGSLITLSRSVILTFSLYILYLFFNSSLKLKRSLLFAIIIGVLGVIYSGIFEKIDYSRLENSISMIKTKEIGYSEEERISAYTRPFEHLIKYPFSIIFGHGLSPEKQDNIYILFDGDIKGKHGFPGAIIYDRGFIAFIVMLIFIVSFYTRVIKTKSGEYFYFLNVLLLINLVAPILFEHYLFDNIVGSYQLFFLLALILSLKKINTNYESERMYYYKK